MLYNYIQATQLGTAPQADHAAWNGRVSARCRMLLLLRVALGGRRKGTPAAWGSVTLHNMLRQGPRNTHMHVR
jgi:hypothetical protein